MEDSVLPTRKEYAQYFVDEFVNKLGMREFCPDMIYSSSSLAVAAEYLGLLQGEHLEYAKSRDGSVQLLVLKDCSTRVVTFRHVLNSLPD